MALVRQGGIEPLLFGCADHPTGRGHQLSLEWGERLRRSLRLSPGGEQGQIDGREIEQVG